MTRHESLHFTLLRLTVLQQHAGIMGLPPHLYRRRRALCNSSSGTTLMSRERCATVAARRAPMGTVVTWQIPTHKFHNRPRGDIAQAH